jgi:hypothetical protein
MMNLVPTELLRTLFKRHQLNLSSSSQRKVTKVHNKIWHKSHSHSPLGSPNEHIHAQKNEVKIIIYIRTGDVLSGRVLA